MNTSLKKLCIYSLCDSLGQIMQEQSDNEAVQWRGQKLQEAGEYALNNCNIKIDKSKLGQASRTINTVFKDGDSIDILHSLLFILCGLCDLEEHNADMIIVAGLMRRVNWSIKEWDAQLNKTELYIKITQQYECWLKEN